MYLKHWIGILFFAIYYVGLVVSEVSDQAVDSNSNDVQNTDDPVPFPTTQEEVWAIVKPFLETLLTAYTLACQSAVKPLENKNLEPAFKNCTAGATQDLLRKWSNVSQDNQNEVFSLLEMFEKIRNGSAVEFVHSKDLVKLRALQENLIFPLCPFVTHAVDCLKSNYTSVIEQCREDNAGELVDAFSASIALICSIQAPGTANELIRTGRMPCIAAGVTCFTKELFAGSVRVTKQGWCNATTGVDKCFLNITNNGDEACRGSMNLEVSLKFKSGFCTSSNNTIKSRSTDHKDTATINSSNVATQISTVTILHYSTSGFSCSFLLSSLIIAVYGF